MAAKKRQNVFCFFVFPLCSCFTVKPELLRKSKTHCQFWLNIGRRGTCDKRYGEILKAVSVMSDQVVWTPYRHKMGTFCCLHSWLFFFFPSHNKILWSRPRRLSVAIRLSDETNHWGAQLWAGAQKIKAWFYRYSLKLNFFPYWNYVIIFVQVRFWDLLRWMQQKGKCVWDDVRLQLLCRHSLGCIKKKKNDLRTHTTPTPSWAKPQLSMMSEGG